MAPPSQGSEPAANPGRFIPEKIDRLEYCKEIGVDRVVFSLPAAGRDELMPIIDRWAELKSRMDA